MIYKLKYDTKEQAFDDLVSKGVINADGTYTSITHAVVWVGLIIDEEGEYNEEGEVITPPTYIDGYHVDVMLRENIDFGSNEVEPNKPIHKFY